MLTFWDSKLYSGESTQLLMKGYCFTVRKKERKERKGKGRKGKENHNHHVYSLLVTHALPLPFTRFSSSLFPQLLPCMPTCLHFLSFFSAHPFAPFTPPSKLTSTSTLSQPHPHSPPPLTISIHKSNDFIKKLTLWLVII